ncbi:replicative DNA helicase [Avibacterium sp. 21-599]|uniref:replicative DNA helicase n=1 Tax=Avibacterium sp. 21-599 TaxID=2911528 RepID=UPI002247DF83|nr:replicative DNA helicase [Avibacterium sp. 21-599]MCW9718575.1 replicative DNA helicase [Avibacterium sp. 21-599]
MSSKPFPAYSFETEQSVLGGLILSNDKWDDVSLLLTEHNFYHHEHRQIYSAIRELIERKQSVDLLTLERTLKEKGILEECGGLAYLAEICKETPSASNILAYADIVRNDSQARKLFALGNLLRAETIKINSRDKLESLIEQTEKSLTEIVFNQADIDTTVDLNQVMLNILDQIDANFENKSGITGVPFGIDRLDNNTSGAQDGDLIILAARPSMGKTALSLKFAETALEHLKEKDTTVQYFSLEMPAEQLMQRLISMRTRVSMQKYRQAIHLSDEDLARFNEAFIYIRENWRGRFLIDDSSYLTPQLLRSRVRRNARKYGKPGLIIVDYLQLMSDPEFKNGNNRTQEISSISRALKALAKEMACPVIALSQLNRNLEQRADKRPLQADLRESGSIEQDADVILFVYRDEVYHNNTEYPGIAEIIIGKQRNGPIGTVMAKFRGEFSLFENLSADEYQRLVS